MSEDNILGWLQLGSYLNVVQAIKTSPKTAKELSRITNISDIKIAEMLGILEKAQAIEYTGNGWKITELTQKVLSKYFE